MTVERKGSLLGEREELGERTGEVVDVPWVAERLSVNPETVRRMIRRGGLPAEHLGNKWVSYEEVVEAFAEGYSRKVGTPFPEEQERLDRAIQAAYDRFSQIKAQRESDLTDVPGVAQTLGINPESVRRLIRRGELPASKFGNKFLIKIEDLERFSETYNPRPGARPKGDKPLTS